MVDLNIISKGETSTPLQLLLQEIDIIMTSLEKGLVTNPKLNMSIDKFLFKSGVSANVVERHISDCIYANITSDNGFRIQPVVKFLTRDTEKDMMYIEIQVDSTTAHERLSYTF